ncbi:MAG: peptidyl-prolyl cis-trans isomerase [Abditibacteriales bacterium]|nr:peptidyl-prolyl cis-trans isomerase [Abditibacteriales bacterium]MDW8364632.1 peptidyl-prolyl cis-trans isomerase [Abditibacteriales bacterium]
MAADKTVAVVNGMPITESQLHQALIARAGVIGLQQMIDEKLLEQAARRHGVSVSDKELDEALQLHKKRFLSARDFQEHIRMFGYASEADYRRSLRRDLLTDKIVAQQAKPTDTDLRTYHAQHPEEFTEPERVQVRDILLSNPQSARELLKALRSPGSDFAALAKIFSEDPTTKSKGGDRGIERLEDLAKPLADAIRKLAPGEISDVVENQGAWHILKLERRLPRRRKTFEECAEEVRRVVEKQKREQLKLTLMQRLRERAKVQINDPRLQAAWNVQKR